MKRRKFKSWSKYTFFFIVCLVIIIIVFNRQIWQTTNLDGLNETSNSTFDFGLIAPPAYSERVTLGNATNQTGVVYYDSEKAYNGIAVIHGTFITPNGMILFSQPCQVCVFLGRDDIVAQVLNPKPGFARITDAELVWNIPTFSHHDISYYDGKLYTVTGEYHDFLNASVLFDTLQVYALDGTWLHNWSTYEHLNEITAIHDNETFTHQAGLYNKSLLTEADLDMMRHRIIFYNLSNATPYYADYYHTNFADIIPANERGKTDSRFREGNILLSLSNPGVILILDQDTYEIVWAYFIRHFIHAPNMLENGNILVFVNDYTNTTSQALEFDPVTKETVWEYHAPDFFSVIMGYAQRLPNGNTLISEATKGRVFELTPEKEIVWEWINPDTTDNHVPESFYRMRKYDAKTVLALLNGTLPEGQVIES